jgi:hypothetical protein
MKFLHEIRGGDRVAIMLMFTGILIVTLATLSNIYVVFHAPTESELDRILTSIKDYFAVGTGLIGAATIALKLQSKPPDGPPPPPPAPPTVTK